MDQPSLGDYRWLVSEAAAPWFDRAADQDTTPALIQSLRREIGADRARLVIQQAELRRRAVEKFPLAADLFFTRKALEQASGSAVAAYKAARFPAAMAIADLCCGIGGDAMALAERGRLVAVDFDPVAALLCEANCRAAGAANFDVRVEDVAADSVSTSLSACGAWHIDPDRRAGGRRTVDLRYYQPGLDAIEQMLAVAPNGAVKLAPATRVPPNWQQSAELQWIGATRECSQQVAWFGSLARHPGQRTATVLPRDDGSPPRSVIGRGNSSHPSVSSIGRYLFEPHAAVLAAGLASQLAREHDLHAISPGVAYLTGDRLVRDAALSAFEVTDVLPLKVRQIQEVIRTRGIGRLEVKKRGVADHPEEVRRRLRLSGDEPATLLLTRVAGAPKAILARRT